jgi:hypothetical protein
MDDVTAAGTSEVKAHEFGPEATETISGVLHVYVAFDWGEEVDLAAARALVPSELRQLPRRPRTPPSITYRPLPLHFRGDPLPLALPVIGKQETTPEVTLFDFGAASVALHVPWEVGAAELALLAGSLSEGENVVAAVQEAVTPLYERLKPAMRNAAWSELYEEYFVFQLLPGQSVQNPEALLKERGSWLAAMLRLDDEPLSNEEIAEALRLHVSYSPADLFLPDWAAAVLLDANCEETLHVIEFANLQLLELRHIDDRLETRLEEAYGLIHRVARTWLPFWRPHTRPLRALGELKVEANELFERTSNVLKLVGDQYLARVYRMLAGRFHLSEWTNSIQRSLAVLEGVYRVLSDQAATYRTEVLEAIIILLILVEVVMTLLGH